MILSYVPPFIAGLHRAAAEGAWTRALRLCRTLDEDYLWATLAAVALVAQNLQVAESAYGELLDVSL